VLTRRGEGRESAVFAAGSVVYCGVCSWKRSILISHLAGSWAQRMQRRLAAVDFVVAIGESLSCNDCNGAYLRVSSRR